MNALHVVQKLDASSAAHEAAQRELEAALEAQRLAHAEVQNRTCDIEHAQVRPCQYLQLAEIVHCSAALKVYLNRQLVSLNMPCRHYSYKLKQ